MSGSWIKMRTSLATDPHVVRIASALDADTCPPNVRELLVVGALHKTWALADEHTEDGFLPGYTPEVLDRLVGIQGWSEALEAVGWLVVTPDGIAIPHFESHNGASAKRRAKEAARKRAVRKASAPDADRKRTREEERREEKSVCESARAREDTHTPSALQETQIRAAEVAAGFPALAESPEVVRAFQRWLRERVESGAQAPGRGQLEAWFGLVAEYHPAVAVKTLEDALAGGWKTIRREQFEERGAGVRLAAESASGPRPHAFRRAVTA